VSGLEDEGQIALWELKQNGSVGAFKAAPKQTPTKRTGK
jgi:hypothetical protein